MDRERAAVGIVSFWFLPFLVLLFSDRLNRLNDELYDIKPFLSNWINDHFLPPLQMMMMTFTIMRVNIDPPLILMPELWNKNVSPTKGGPMMQHLYDELWHYSERFSRDPIQRSELLTMAWKEGERLGSRCTNGLMKSMMHFRSKELNVRSAFPTREVGKSQKDAWNRPERVYLDMKLSVDDVRSIADVVLNTYTTPLDYAITNDFLNSLSVRERAILEDLSAGYTYKEIAERHHVSPTLLKSLRNDLASKAVAYLM